MKNILLIFSVLCAIKAFGSQVYTVKGSLKVIGPNKLKTMVITTTDGEQFFIEQGLYLSDYQCEDGEYILTQKMINNVDGYNSYILEKEDIKCND